MSPTYKKRLWDLQNGLCWICHAPLDLSLEWPNPKFVTGDHLRPKSKGGKGLHNNQLLAHSECNHKRGAGNPVTMRSALLAMNARRPQSDDGGP